MARNSRTVRAAVWYCGLPLCIAAAAIGLLIAAPTVRRAYEPCRVWSCDTGAQLVPVDIGDGRLWVDASCDDTSRAVLRLLDRGDGPGTYRASMCNPDATMVSELVEVSPGLNSTRLRMYAVADDTAVVSAWYDAIPGWTGFVLGGIAFAGLAIAGAVSGVAANGRILPDGEDEAAYTEKGDGDVGRRWKCVALWACGVALLWLAAATTTAAFASTFLSPSGSRMCETTTCIVTGPPTTHAARYYAQCGPLRRASLASPRSLHDGDVVRASQCPDGMLEAGPTPGTRIFYEVPTDAEIDDNDVPVSPSFSLGRDDTPVFGTMVVLAPTLVTLAICMTVVTISWCWRAKDDDSRALEYVLEHGYTRAYKRYEDAKNSRLEEVCAGCSGGPMPWEVGDQFYWTITATRGGRSVRFEGYATADDVFGADSLVSRGLGRRIDPPARDEKVEVCVDSDEKAPMATEA